MLQRTQVYLRQVYLLHGHREADCHQTRLRHPSNARHRVLLVRKSPLLALKDGLASYGIRCDVRRSQNLLFLRGFFPWLRCLVLGSWIDDHLWEVRWNVRVQYVQGYHCFDLLNIWIVLQLGHKSELSQAFCLIPGCVDLDLEPFGKGKVPYLDI